MIKKIGVIGTGEMGRGLSLVFSKVGLNVTVVGLTQADIDDFLKRLSEGLDRRIAKYELTNSEKKVLLANIKTTSNLEDIAGVDFVMEAIFEDLREKVKLFEKLDSLTRTEVILASCTSSLSISELAEATKRPDKVIGLHFLYPPTRRMVVEVIRGLDTSDDTYVQAKDLVKLVGKEAVEVFESPGFITTRVILPFINEAMYTLMEGVATARDIDKAIRIGYDFSMGPLELADTIGLDEVMSWLEVLFRDLGDVKYRPCPLLRKMVRAKRLGKKTKKGFFEYDDQLNRIDEPEDR
ncbi:3-hydroxybutyryl-CoA dehydrogenase [bacterium]|nr:3-hydroxybutyryl-CoA dehydrogenase [bacterium]